jgi:hypothetical protein
MKKLILLSITLMSLTSFGQQAMIAAEEMLNDWENDTIVRTKKHKKINIDTIAVQADTTTSEFETYAGVVVASRNYARGVNFGAGPSIQPYAGITYKGLTLDFFGALSGNGAYDYGTTMDFSLSYETNGFKVGLHDYYFFSKYGNHNYFLENGSDTMNGHYYEVQAMYASNKFHVLAGYNFWNTNLKIEDDYWTGVYLEAGFNVTEEFSLVAGGVTGPSILNFYDAAGITTIGVDWSREMEIADLPAILDVKFHVNPNYKNIAPGVQQAPMNLFVSLTF